VYLCGEALCFGLFVIGRLVLNSYKVGRPGQNRQS
jgi:hypothetical protein